MPLMLFRVSELAKGDARSGCSASARLQQQCKDGWNKQHARHRSRKQNALRHFLYIDRSEAGIPPPCVGLGHPEGQAELGSPQIISASGSLANGSTINFDASVQRQRAALLLANGNIYAGFAAFCDYQASRSRGWVLAWDMKTLKPAGKPQLLNKAVSADDFDCYFNSPDTQNHPCFLTSVWMSGAGIAADNGGDIYYVTGNTSPGILRATRQQQFG